MDWPRHRGFLSAYFANRKDATRSSLDDSPIAQVLFRNQEFGGLSDLTLSAAQLLEGLRQEAPKRILRSPLWPKTPTLLSNQLHRLAPQLREHGIDVTFMRNSKGRFITINSAQEPWSGQDEC
jgi:hypothetical protein